MVVSTALRGPGRDGKRVKVRRCSIKQNSPAVLLELRGESLAGCRGLTRRGGPVAVLSSPGTFGMG